MTAVAPSASAASNGSCRRSVSTPCSPARWAARRGRAGRARGPSARCGPRRRRLARARRGSPCTWSDPMPTPSAPTPRPAVGSSTSRRRSPARSGAPRAARPRRRSAAPRRRPPRHVDQRHAALRDGAGLVEHHGVDRARLLEDLRALDEDAELRAATGADQQRGRRREPEGARARDDQHGDRRGERRSARPAPDTSQAAERHDREHEHHRDEHRRDAVGQALDGRLARLGGRDQPTDLGQPRLLADAGRSHDEGARRVDRRARHLVAGADVDRARARPSAATRRARACR